MDQSRHVFVQIGMIMSTGPLKLFSVVGLSYAFCGRTRLPEEFISENLIFVDFRQGICVYTSDQTSIGDLYAATKLQQL